MSTPDWLQRVRNGEPFTVPDAEFLQAVFAAHPKIATYTSDRITSLEAMQAALRELFGRVGEGVVVAPPLFVDVGFNIEIGDGTFINTNVTLLDTYPIRIGCRVLIGPNCAFYPVGHPVRAADRFIRAPDGSATAQITSGAPITIEDEVFIGGSTIVLPGVTIGARTTIGAGSVVTKSIPSDVFAAGNPCKVIRPL